VRDGEGVNARRWALAKYRDGMPQVGGGLFLTDDGIETTLIFHDGLNDSPDLDTGDPAELGAQYAALKGRLPSLKVMGGCCGTDHSM
jgi:hypothetical protein